MRTFIIAERDPFAQTLDNVALAKQQTAGGGGSLFDHVRRPLRGIQIKADTYATLEVMTSDQKHISMVNSSV